MSEIGTAAIAGDFEHLATGPATWASFEVQEGFPVDQSNASLRQYSPFTIRLIPPDTALFANLSQDASGEVDLTEALDVISAASTGYDGNGNAADLYQTLFRATSTQLTPEVVESVTNQLDTLVTTGQFLGDENASFIPAMADAYAAMDIYLQLWRMLQTPPLTLLVNPASLQLSFTKIQSYSDRNRWGYIFESHGMEQPKLSISGSTGGFMAGDTGLADAQVTGDNTTPSGLQYASKRNSAAWQNFMSLYRIYRNNGLIFDTVNRTEAHHLVGAVAIDWDQWTYVGHFENLNFRYDEAMPHRVEFDMEFTVDRMYDNASPTYAVLPMAAPTDNPATSSPSGTRSQFASARTTLQATDQGDPRPLAGVNEEGQVVTVSGSTNYADMPLDLLGSF